MCCSAMGVDFRLSFAFDVQVGAEVNKYKILSDNEALLKQWKREGAGLLSKVGWENIELGEIIKIS